MTGSFGRLEASSYSDLDLFFISKTGSQKRQIPRIEKTLLDSDLIRTARELKFPEFSNDGMYLSVHYLEDIKRTLGSRDDDHLNHFTARLLLLLESRPLHNDEVYNEIVKELICCYFRDYQDHESSFHPLFLVNDIIRFWRTLCLNYEHRRNWPEDEGTKNKNHLNNLKLKFSRMLTCYSAIALLLADGDVVEPDQLLRVVKLSPLQRLDKVAALRQDTAQNVSTMKEYYAWFLECTGKTRETTLLWIGNESTRKDAFERGKDFGNQMYKVILKLTDENEFMRYLVI